MATADITQLLQQARQGQRGATDKLMLIVYDQLKRLAESYLKSEKSGHTLAATALVHEAYLRLAGSEVDWKDRVHFFAVAARQMRHILVDHAKARHRIKRGSGGEKIPVSDVTLAYEERPLDVIAVDEALARLAEFDPRKSQIVELLYFGGLTLDETAEAIGASVATVQRELKIAKAWLHTQLKGNTGGS
ncbi:MAG TPA: sigma-70 family RNA polymerase sigma factor [Verrucomicrobiae bacterium]|nr:sigma-70 family RNA polymerase sigma factor [Verrucomicrobiae bacterium]